METVKTMRATDLQIRLAHLAPGETLLLPVTEVEGAFPSYTTSEQRLHAAAALGVLYRCTLTLCGPDESQVLFTRHNGPSNVNCA